MWISIRPTRKISTRCCCRVAVLTRTRFALSQTRVPSRRRSSMPGNRLQRSHGLWTVIETGAARGRRMTSWPSLKTDLKNAGAEWVDQEGVVDQRLPTNRKPDDIPAFNTAVIKLFAGARGQ